MAGKTTGNALRERVTIQAAAAAYDAYGAEVLTWAEYMTVWAKVVERGGREPVLADRPVMVVSYEVTIRSGPTVTHKHRLTWRGKTLTVDTVTPLVAEGLIVLRCLETEG